MTGRAQSTAGPTPEPTAVEAADLADKYDQMLRLADLFDTTGEEMRRRAKLGQTVLADEGVAESAVLSARTYRAVEEELRAAGNGKQGLLTRGVELDADALMVRATVLTYRWIDDLQEAAYRTLGSIAGRAIGYLAPEVALGGAIVSAGLIETDAVDRDDIAGYLNELAEQNPDLLEHVTSGGGGLLDSLTMRSLLTASVLAGESGRAAMLGGQRAAGITAMLPDFGSALRDVAGSLIDTDRAGDQAGTDAEPVADGSVDALPRGLEHLMTILVGVEQRVHVRRIADHRYIAFLPGARGKGRLRLVGGDTTAYAAEVVAAIEHAVADDPDARVMLVGAAQGGVTAAEIATQEHGFVIDQVVTAGAPSAQVPRIPDTTRVLSLEDRADPVAVLGSLISAGSANRLTLVFDAASSGRDGIYVAGGRAADSADHPEVRAELQRLQDAGYLAG